MDWLLAIRFRILTGKSSACGCLTPLLLVLGLAEALLRCSYHISQSRHIVQKSVNCRLKEHPGTLVFTRLQKLNKKAS